MIATVADSATAAVFFGALLLLVCLAGAIYEGISDRRDRRQARDWNRAMRKRAS